MAQLSSDLTDPIATNAPTHDCTLSEYDYDTYQLICNKHHCTLRSDMKEALSSNFHRSIHRKYSNYQGERCEPACSGEGFCERLASFLVIKNRYPERVCWLTVRRTYSCYDLGLDSPLM